MNQTIGHAINEIVYSLDDAEKMCSFLDNPETEEMVRKILKIFNQNYKFDAVYPHFCDYCDEYVWSHCMSSPITDPQEIHITEPILKFCQIRRKILFKRLRQIP